jgi:hypothetical protein
MGLSCPQQLRYQKQNFRDGETDDLIYLDESNPDSLSYFLCCFLLVQKETNKEPEKPG